MAYHFYVATEGTKQGQFKGGSPRKGWEDASEVFGFDYKVEAPLDANQGMASGKRQHSPITVRKEVDSASPKLLQALCTNEAFKEVHIHYWCGRQRHILKLTNATISSIKPVAIPGVQGPCEQVELSPEKIENMMDFSR